MWVQECTSAYRYFNSYTVVVILEEFSNYVRFSYKMVSIGEYNIAC